MIKCSFQLPPQVRYKLNQLSSKSEICSYFIRYFYFMLVLKSYMYEEVMWKNLLLIAIILLYIKI